MFDLFFTKVMAAGTATDVIQGIYPNSLGVKNIVNLFTMLETSYGKIYSIITVVAGTLAVCAILYGGIKYMTAGGDAKKAGEAKDALTRAVIGVIIITTAYGIITLGKAVSAMLNKTISNSALPTATPSATVDPDETEYDNSKVSDQLKNLPDAPDTSGSSSSAVLNTGQGPVANPTPNPTPTPDPIIPEYLDPNLNNPFPNLH